MKGIDEIEMRPLTATMIELLKESLQREIEKKPPLDTYYTRSTKGLFARGLICMEEYNLNGKILMRFYITNKGRNYLKNLTGS